MNHEVIHLDKSYLTHQWTVPQTGSLLVCLVPSITRTTRMSRAVGPTANEPKRGVQQEWPHWCSRKHLRSRFRSSSCLSRCSAKRRRSDRRYCRLLGLQPYPLHSVGSWNLTYHPSTTRVWSPEIIFFALNDWWIFVWLVMFDEVIHKKIDASPISTIKSINLWFQ